MKANTDHRRRRTAPVRTGIAAQKINIIDPPGASAVPRPRIQRNLTSMPALERAAEVLRYSFARAEYWLSPGGGLRAALRRALLFWCLLVIAGLLVGPMITLLLGQLASWSGLLAFAVQQLMLLPLGIGVFLLGIKGLVLLWRRLFRR
jgi:hypothetical protein